MSVDAIVTYVHACQKELTYINHRILRDKHEIFNVFDIIAGKIRHPPKDKDCDSQYDDAAERGKEHDSPFPVQAADEAYRYS